MVNQLQESANLPDKQEQHADRQKCESAVFLSISLSKRQLCDVELLLNGGFAPLVGFPGEEEYGQIVEKQQLLDGTLWPIPITLDVPKATADKIELGMQLALRDDEGFMLAIITVSDVWRPDKLLEAEKVYGTTSSLHPGVNYLLDQVGEYYIGGRLTMTQLPTHYDYDELRHTPAELKEHFKKMGWRNVVAFHTSTPMHRIQRDITLLAAKNAKAHILLHPAIGETKPRDLDYHVRVRCYQAIQRHYPHRLTMLSLLPLAMRMAGAREALWHALIRQNYGCSHIILGFNHAFPPIPMHGGEQFYTSHAILQMIEQYQQNIGIHMLYFEKQGFALSTKRLVNISRGVTDSVTEESVETAMSAQQLGKRLASGEDIPSWFSFASVIEALSNAYPPRSRQGICLFFTGLSGAGKSTIAKIIYGKFLEQGLRNVTLLDGDIVRHNLSSELGFSKTHRDLNIRRIGFVANEITKNGGVAICAPIAPYTKTRKAVRALIEQNHGAFVEIFVATPLDTCENRDTKGLYAKARKGLIPEFTGISDPYEEPVDHEIRIDTTDITPMQSAQEVYLYLLGEGYLDDDKLGPLIT